MTHDLAVAIVRQRCDLRISLDCIIPDVAIWRAGHLEQQARRELQEVLDRLVAAGGPQEPRTATQDAEVPPAPDHDGTMAPGASGEAPAADPIETPTGEVPARPSPEASVEYRHHPCIIDAPPVEDSTPPDPAPAALPASAPQATTPLTHTDGSGIPCPDEAIAPTPPDPARGAHRDSVPPEDPPAPIGPASIWIPDEDAIFERCSSANHALERYRSAFPASTRTDASVRSRYYALQKRAIKEAHRKHAAALPPADDPVVTAAPGTPGMIGTKVQVVDRESGMYKAKGVVTKIDPVDPTRVLIEIEKDGTTWISVDQLAEA